MKTGGQNPFRVGTKRWVIYEKLLTYKPIKIRRQDVDVVIFARERFGVKIKSLGKGKYIMMSATTKVHKKDTVSKAALKPTVYTDGNEVIEERASMMIITILQVLTLLGQFILAIAYIVK
jgi:hypothetical protein